MSPPARLERILPFLGLTVFLDLVGFGIILPLLPSYISEMGGTAQTVGVLLSSFAAAQLVATPVLGRLSDRYGRRRVIVLSLGANVIAMLLFALAARDHALWLLFVSRMLAGATSGNIGACQAVIADISDGPQRVRAMGKLGAGIGLGMMLGPWIGGRASQWGAAAPPLVAGAMAFVALAGVFVFLPETNPGVGLAYSSADPGRFAKGFASLTPGVGVARATTDSVPAKRPRLSLAALVDDPKIGLVMVLYFLTFLYMTTLQTALALLAAERFLWTKNNVSDLFGLFGLVNLVVQFGIVGPISSRIAPGFVVTGAGVLAAIGLSTIGFAPVPAGMVIGLVLLAAGIGLTQPQLAALASHYAGASRQGTVLGFAQSSGSLARTLGPLLWGALYHHVGATASFVGGSIAALSACLVAFRTRGERSAS